MATVSLEQAVNSHGPDPLHAATGKDPIHDNEAFGDQPGSMDL